MATQDFSSLVRQTQFIVTFSGLAGMMFGWWMKPQWDKWMAPLYTVYVGLGADKLFTQTKVTNKRTKVKERLPERLRSIPVDKDTVFTNEETGGRIVAYNSSTNGKLEPKGRLGSLYDNIDAADDQASQNIERVHKSHGEIPWVLLALIGIIGIVMLVAIVFAGALWYANNRVNG